MKTNHKVRVAALGDLHVHETRTQSHQELFRRIEQEADVLVLCGDLTHFGTEPEARHLAEELHAISIPTVGVLGNHDCESGNPAAVKRILQEQIHFLEEEPFRLNGVGFAGVKGFGGGFDGHMLSSFGEEATKAFVAEAVQESMRLQKALQDVGTEHCVVALHYAPIAETVEGESPTLFPYLGCSRLAEVIDRFPVDAVFHGHAHHGKPEGRTLKGVPVFNCSEVLMKEHSPERPFALVEIDAS